MREDSVYSKRRTCLLAILGLVLSASAFGKSVEAEGVVTFTDFRRRVCYLLTARNETIRCTHRYKESGPKVGDYCKVKGELRKDDRWKVLDHIKYTLVRRAPELLPRPVMITIGELLAYPNKGGKGLWWNGRPVIIEGTVRKVEHFGDETRIDFADGDAELTVIVLAQVKQPCPDWVAKGARVRADGIFECIYDYRILPGSATVVNPYVYISEPGKFALVSSPSWWTRERLVTLLTLLGGIAFASLVWALFLRRLVRSRTAELVREQGARMRTEIESDAIARERLRLSYDLHDDLQQLLAGTMCRLKAGVNYLGRHDEIKSLSQLAFAQQAVMQTQTALRHILWGLHDASKGPGSLVGLFNYALKRFPQWNGIVEISSQGEERETSRRHSGALLMVLQEAVGNAIRHGEATKVKVEVVFRPKLIVMSVVDNGKGFVVGEIDRDPSHLGLASMRLRAKQNGGRFEIESTPGKGTVVRVTMVEE